MDQLIFQTKQRMQKVIEHLLEELVSIHSGRATPALIESTKVIAYGSAMILRDLATINVPEPRTLVVQPWDQDNVEPIVKAIRENGLGFNPISEGNVVRVAIPALSEERRGQLIKIVGEKSEVAKIAIRNLRREALDEIDKNERSGSISKDDAKRFSDNIQKITEELTGEVERVIENKEEELKEI